MPGYTRFTSNNLDPTSPTYPVLCERIFELAKVGMSLEDTAAAVHCSPTSIKTFPDTFLAWKRGRAEHVFVLKSKAMQVVNDAPEFAENSQERQFLQRESNSMLKKLLDLTESVNNSLELMEQEFLKRMSDAELAQLIKDKQS